MELRVASGEEEKKEVFHCFGESKSNDSKRKKKALMDKKAKKKIDVLRKRITVFQQKLAGATQQMDDPAEVEQLRKEIAAAQEQIEKLKGE